MKYDERHDVLYSTSFENYSKGHALYKPVSGAKLKPGMCGYFDHTGDWTKIVDLTQPTEIEKGNWKQPGHIASDPDSGTTLWGTLWSKSMIKFPIKVEADVNIPQTPVKVGFRIGYDRKEDTGGILVTDSDVTHNQIEASSSTRAKDWCINNAEKILQEYATAKDKGIFIVTKTYTVTRRAVALLQSKDESLAFSVNAEFPGGGKVAPEIGWWTSQKEEAWEITENDEGVVVFMSGWYWRPKLFRKKVSPTEKPPQQKKFLGPGDKRGTLELHSQPDDETLETVRLVPERFGDYKFETD